MDVLDHSVENESLICTNGMVEMGDVRQFFTGMEFALGQHSVRDDKTTCSIVPYRKYINRPSFFVPGTTIT